MPSITPQLELLDMDRPLRLCCEGGAWEHNVERDRLMYRTRVRIDGTPGDSLLCACDAAAADGESLLDPDSLKVRACSTYLPAHLHGPSLRQCGPRRPAGSLRGPGARCLRRWPAYQRRPRTGCKQWAPAEYPITAALCDSSAPSKRLLNFASAM
jgi:hypothetical protein